MSTWIHPGEYIPVQLDQDQMSEPDSVPLPSEDFEPFFSDYVEYDQRLSSALNSVQDLGIHEPLNYQVFDPAIDSEFTITRPVHSHHDFEDPEPAQAAWSSPTKNAPLPHWNSSPVKQLRPAPSLHLLGKPPQMHMPIPPQLSPHMQQHMMPPLHSPQGHAHPQHLRSPMMQEHMLHSPVTPAQGFLYSPSHPGDLPSSPPGSPQLQPAFRPTYLSTDSDSLGIRINIKSEDEEDNSEENEQLNWQPVLTIPAETQRESEKIIKSQRSMTELRTKRKSCLPPGAVDEYISTPVDGEYRCLYPHCNRMFRRKYNLKSHIQTHLCDRPYVCEVCDATFVRPHDLKRHELCHQSTRQFVCPCGKGFTRADAMHRHRLRQICDGGLGGQGQGGVQKPKSPRKKKRDQDD